MHEICNYMHTDIPDFNEITHCTCGQEWPCPLAGTRRDYTARRV